MKKNILNFLLILTLLVICACSSTTAQVMKDSDNVQVVKIAVLPVEYKGPDNKASELFRSRLLDELYFKGYPKLKLETIDSKLETLYAGQNKKNVSQVTPQILKDGLGVDAGMYCTLTQEIKSKIFYAPLKLSVRCELRRAGTGETLWRADSESAERSFNFTNKGLEKNSHDYLESVIEEVVNKITKTLPDGPNLRG